MSDSQVYVRLSLTLSLSLSFFFSPHAVPLLCPSPILVSTPCFTCYFMFLILLSSDLSRFLARLFSFFMSFSFCLHEDLSTALPLSTEAEGYWFDLGRCGHPHLRADVPDQRRGALLGHHRGLERTTSSFRGWHMGGIEHVTHPTYKWE